MAEKELVPSITYINEMGTLQRVLIVLVLFALSVCTAAEAKKRALLIGISEYPQLQAAESSWANIHGANDANLLSATLKKQGFSVGELLNGKATALRIRESLKDLATQSVSGDLVYIHFSCHGQPFEDTSGDESDGWDESIVPYDAQKVYNKKYKGENHIIDDELEQYINRIRTKVGPSGFVYVVLDACHVGGASRDESETAAEAYTRGTDRGFSSNSKKYIPKIDRRGHLKVRSSAEMSGVCFIEACRSYQSNSEIKVNGTYYGPLSFYINRYLSMMALSSNTSWTNSVVRDMGQDKRLIKQNPVIETDR